MMHSLSSQPSPPAVGSPNDLWFAQDQNQATNTINASTQATSTSTQTTPKPHEGGQETSGKAREKRGEPLSPMPKPGVATEALAIAPSAEQQAMNKASSPMTSQEGSAIIKSVSTNETSAQNASAQPPQEVTTDELSKEEVVINLH
jgi:hypothetical protein